MKENLKNREVRGTYYMSAFLADEEARGLFLTLQKTPSSPQALDSMERFCRSRLAVKRGRYRVEEESGVAVDFVARGHGFYSMSPNIMRKWRNAAISELRIALSFGEYAKALSVISFFRKMTNYAEIAEFAV